MSQKREYHIQQANLFISGQSPEEKMVWCNCQWSQHAEIYALILKGGEEWYHSIIPQLLRYTNNILFLEFLELKGQDTIVH